MEVIITGLPDVLNKAFPNIPYWADCTLELSNQGDLVSIHIKDFDPLIDFILKKTTLDKSANPFNLPFDIKWIR